MRFAVLAVLVGVSAGAVRADEPDLPVPGSRELTVGVVGTQLRPSVKTTSGRINFGWYRNPRLQFGLEYEPQRSRALGVFANQYVRLDSQERRRTFFGAFVGGNKDSAVIGLQAGLKEFHGSGAGTWSVTPQALWRRPTHSGGRDTLGVELGLSYLLR